jgi:S-formylglutathione hydrolase FrmB
MTVKSANLKGRGDICIFVPPAITESSMLPVVLLLHGVYGSAWAWTHNAGVHLQAMSLIKTGALPPMIIAMPSDGLWGDGSGYLAHSGLDFERWIVEDVVQALFEKIQGVTKDSPLFIGGLSMGGFGALRIGAKYGKRFRGISAHSSITNLGQMSLFVEEDIANYRQQELADEDVFETIQNYRMDLPPLRFDCGTNDQLIEQNRLLHRQMLDAGIRHTYHEYPGAHEWSYWETHITESLRFFADQLPVANPKPAK